MNNSWSSNIYYLTLNTESQSDSQTFTFDYMTQQMYGSSDRWNLYDENGYYLYTHYPNIYYSWDTVF